MQYTVFNASDLGGCVRATRKAQGMTQKELSDFYTAFSREFLSDLENGKPTVELGKALSVLNALGLRVSITYDEEQSDGFSP